MEFYVGVNSNGSEIISKQKLKRYLNYEENKKDVLSYNDTQQPKHWMLDFTDVEIPKTGVFPVDVYLTLPAGSIKKMFGIELTWEDDYQIVNL